MAKECYICPLVMAWKLPVAEYCLSFIGAVPVLHIICAYVRGPYSTQICREDQPWLRMTMWEECCFPTAGIYTCFPRDLLGLFDAFRGHLIFHVSLSDSWLRWVPLFLAVCLDTRSQCHPSYLAILMFLPQSWSIAILGMCHHISLRFVSGSQLMCQELQHSLWYEH